MTYLGGYYNPHTEVPISDGRCPERYAPRSGDLVRLLVGAAVGDCHVNGSIGLGEDDGRAHLAPPGCLDQFSGWLQHVGDVPVATFFVVPQFRIAH